MKDILILIAVAVVAAVLEVACYILSGADKEYHQNKWNDSYGKE